MKNTKLRIRRTESRNRGKIGGKWKKEAENIREER